MPLRRCVAILSSATVIALTEHASGAPIRPFFEPTDLEFEKRGILDVDVQMGSTYGRGAWGRRWVLMDVELDVGLLDNVELDLDASFMSDLQSDGSRRVTSEALWPSMKLGLADFHSRNHAFAFGTQLGPRIPMFTGSGVGYVALGLAGWSYARLHVVLNAGFLLDPGLGVTRGRPTGGLFGVDVVVDLTDHGELALTSELGGAALVSGPGSEAHQTVGLAWEPYRDKLQFSVVLLTGLSPTGDRGSLLFGVSPKMALF